jgi:uncharacterized membrane protein YhaH (DUF805 family)
MEASVNVKQLLFSNKGRVGRKEFWLYSVPAAIMGGLWLLFIYKHLNLMGIMFDMLNRWFPATPNHPPNYMMHLVGLPLFLPVLILWLLLWFSPVIFAVIIASNMYDKRWNDRNRPKSQRWSFLMILLPAMILSYHLNLGRSARISLIAILVAAILWILMELGFLRGTVGDNAYGPDPLLPAMPSGNDTESKTQDQA